MAVRVGFTSSVAIVFQAAQAFNATPEQISSWMWALGLGLCTGFFRCRWFEKVVNRIPMAIASALLAGAMALFGQQYRQRAA